MSRKFNKQNKLHVKKGDLVEVISGNDKGKRGKVLSVSPSNYRVVVEGVNMQIKHQKPNQQYPQGGRIEVEQSLHASNVLPVDPSTDQATRIGRKKIEKDGNSYWVRYAKVSGEVLDK